MEKRRQPNPNLVSLSRQELINAGFQPDFSPEILEEAQKASESRSSLPGLGKDLRDVLWSSIDNESSKDLDQIEYAEVLGGGNIRLLIGIADVDLFVPKASAVDARAFQNTVSVYTPVAIFPMLPTVLSTGVTSLLEGVDRSAVVIELFLTPEGVVSSRTVYRATVRNQAKLDYNSIGNWLEGNSPVPEKVSAVTGLEHQLRLQYDVAILLRGLRLKNGALEFNTTEADATSTNGKIDGIVIVKHNRARDIIENFMIAVNVQIAELLEEKGIPSIRRVVRTPERWPRIVELASKLGETLPTEPDSLALSSFLNDQQRTDPMHFPDLSLSILKLMGPGEYKVESPGEKQEGHFGLAVHDYTHSTAPNRRFPDLVTQRLLKATFDSRESPYSTAELETIAEHCTRMEDAARKIERTTMKAAVASFLSGRIGEEFDAVVTGVNNKGTFLRINNPPADGMVVRGLRHLDVGDRVRSKLVATNPERGFIDFEVLRHES